MDADLQLGREPEMPAALAVDPVTDPIAEFEHFLLTHCSITQSEDELWRCVARGIARLEQTMDAVQVDRFEIAVDFILSRQGLPGWAVIRHRMSRGQRRAGGTGSASPRRA